jgi:hypothetical protein
MKNQKLTAGIIKALHPTTYSFVPFARVSLRSGAAGGG